MSVPVRERLIVRTPFGRPLPWARLGLASDPGDRHPLNDDRSLIVASRDLGGATPAPFDDFVLAILADGASGSQFADGVERSSGGAPRPAGWRASQVAQAVFVESFLGSRAGDPRARLREALRQADRALATSGEGDLATTLTAAFVAADGTACAASVGDSSLLVFPPGRRAAQERPKKLGFREGAALGSGAIGLVAGGTDELMEWWWPEPDHAAGAGPGRLAAGSLLALVSDGIANSLPAELAERLVRRCGVELAPQALVDATREVRIARRRQEGASTVRAGLDNMSALLVRFDGRNGEPRRGQRGTGGRLVCLQGFRGGPSRESDGPFALICLVDLAAAPEFAPAYLRRYLETDHRAPVPERLRDAFAAAAQQWGAFRLAALAQDGAGPAQTFTAAGAAALVGHGA